MTTNAEVRRELRRERFGLLQEWLAEPIFACLERHGGACSFNDLREEVADRKDPDLKAICTLENVAFLFKNADDADTDKLHLTFVAQPPDFIVPPPHLRVDLALQARGGKLYKFGFLHPIEDFQPLLRGFVQWALRRFPKLLLTTETLRRLASKYAPHLAAHITHKNLAPIEDLTLPILGTYTRGNPERALESGGGFTSMLPDEALLARNEDRHSRSRLRAPTLSSASVARGEGRRSRSRSRSRSRALTISSASATREEDRRSSSRSRVSKSSGVSVGRRRRTSQTTRASAGRGK